MNCVGEIAEIAAVNDKHILFLNYIHPAVTGTHCHMDLFHYTYMHALDFGCISVLVTIDLIGCSQYLIQS